MERPGHIFSRTKLLDLVWGHGVYVEERTVDVHMSRLRKAIKSASGDNDIPKSKTNLGCNDLVENVIKSKKKIAWIHNDLQELGFTKDYILSRYQGFNKVVTVSNYCKDAFEELAPEFKSKSYLVHNFISEHEIITKGNLENPYKKKSEKILVTVARIDNHQKRIDRNKINKYEWGDPDRFFAGIELLNNNKANFIVFTAPIFRLHWKCSTICRRKSN